MTSTYTQGVRIRQTLGYRSVILATFVNALRAVFISDYYDAQFENLRVSGEYALTKLSYPAVYVKFTSRKVSAAGVGHVEYFVGTDGIYQPWDHRRFEGMIEFKVVAMSPLDLDILLDNLTEIISFGRLSTILEQFYYTIYGVPGTVQPFATQISLNSDEIEDTGASVGPAPWQPEDVLIYQNSLVCDVHGGFYNISPDDRQPLQFVWEVNQYAYPYGETPISLVYAPGETGWTQYETYVEDPDLSVVTGVSIPSATDIWTHTLAFQTGKANIKNNTIRTQSGVSHIAP